VSYLLVQLGKLVEREQPPPDYPVIKFYRNWVAHPKLDRVNPNPPMRVILRDEADGHKTEAVNRRYAIVSSEGLRDAVRRLESADGYTSSYTQPSSKAASKRNAQKS
jgi:hypothetical protein